MGTSGRMATPTRSSRFAVWWRRTSVSLVRGLLALALPALPALLVLAILVPVMHAEASGPATVAALAEPSPEEAQGGPAAPIKVEVGLFLNNVPEINLQSNRFAFDAYLWFRWDPDAWPPASARDGSDPPASPVDTFEIIDSVDVSKEVLFERPGYCSLKIHGERLNFWDVRDYPFDRQRLEIVIEDASFDLREVRYVPDLVNSGAAEALRVPGAVAGRFESREAAFAYPTNFGDPDLAPGSASAYSRIVFSLPVDRDGQGVFFKLFTALFVSASVAMLALFINPTQVDPRFGLCVGGLFGIVASSYAVNSVLPDASGFSYADKLHAAALLCVLLVVLESVYSLSLHLNHGESGARTAKRLDRMAFVIIAGGYLATVLGLTLSLRS